MSKIERILLITFLGAWAILPDVIPGHIDDVIAIIGLIHQIGQLSSSGRNVIE